MNAATRQRRSLAVHLVAIVSCVMVLGVPTSWAGSPGIGSGSILLQPIARELSAEWWQLFLSLPAAENPLLDDSGARCVSGQRGPVWFLVGAFGDPVTRECSIPEGTALFIPLINGVDVNTSSQSASELRAEIDQCIDATTTLTLVVDGHAVPRREIMRVRSRVFAVSLPDDNVLGLPAGTYSPAVDDGYYALLAPLGVGQHTVHFTAARGGCPISPDPFSLDVTYKLTVVPVSLH